MWKTKKKWQEEEERKHEKNEKINPKKGEEEEELERQVEWTDVLGMMYGWWSISGLRLCVLATLWHRSKWTVAPNFIWVCIFLFGGKTKNGGMCGKLWKIQKKKKKKKNLKIEEKPVRSAMRRWRVHPDGCSRWLCERIRKRLLFYFLFFKKKVKEKKKDEAITSRYITYIHPLILYVHISHRHVYVYAWSEILSVFVQSQKKR